MTFSACYRALERFTALLAALAALLILAMSVWIVYDVLARNLFGVASPWSFDLSEYALVWITFLGAPWVLLQDRHVRIEILLDVLPRHVQRMLGIAVCLVAIGACAVLTWRSGIAAWGYYENNIAMPRIWRIPRIWPYAAVPVGSALLTLCFVARLGLYVGSDDPERALRARASSEEAQPPGGA